MNRLYVRTEQPHGFKPGTPVIFNQGTEEERSLRVVEVLNPRCFVAIPWDERELSEEPVRCMA